MRRTPLVQPGPELDAGELERYSRQIRLPQIGLEGQRRLKNARVLVLGAGGLGSPVLLYLAGAGVGTIGIVDEDTVDVSNLQRQTIHTTAAVATSKVNSAAASIRRLNPLVNVALHETRLTGGNAARILSAYDLVIDGTDNFATRYLANDTAALLGLPYVWGSVLRFDGQVSVFWKNAPGGGVTLRDVFPMAPGDDEAESCSVAGVLGPLCATVGAAMATEALKLIVGFGDLLLGRMLVVDALDGSYTNVPFQRLATPHPTGATTAAAGTHATAAHTGTDATAAHTGTDAKVASTVLVASTAPNRTDPSAALTGTTTPTPNSSQAPTPRASSAHATEGTTMTDDTSATPESAPTPTAAPAPASISPTELAARLAAREEGSDDFVLVDVREPWEREIVAIDGSALVPLASILSEAAAEIMPRDETVIVHCHHDGRSRYAREVLLQSGWTNVTFVEGGIDAWAAEIDPALPRY